jgi:hypothetical protein
VSGLTDLSGIAVRAYTPGVKSGQRASVAAETPVETRPARAAVTDRRLAPAFSIELSLAAQKILGSTVEQAPVALKKAVSSQAAEASATYNQFNEGVGRREVPLASEQRDVAPGSRLNIQI